jgi:hypothetical protein
MFELILNPDVEKTMLVSELNLTNRYVVRIFQTRVTKGIAFKKSNLLLIMTFQFKFKC